MPKINALCIVGVGMGKTDANVSFIVGEGICLSSLGFEHSLEVVWELKI